MVLLKPVRFGILVSSSSSSSSSSWDANTSRIAFFCFCSWTLAFSFIAPLMDSFAFGTTGLATSACFFFASIVAFILSYSAICKCRVNNFAVSKNSSSTIIHSSSRRSNFDTPLCISSTSGCSRSSDIGGGDEDCTRFERSTCLVRALVRGVDGSAVRSGRSSSDSRAFPLPFPLLPKTVSSKKSSSIAFVARGLVACRAALGLTCVRLPAPLFAQGS